MKRKIKHLLLGTLPLFGMLLAGCSFGEKSTSSSSFEPYVPPEGEPEEPEIADDHITAIHMSRTKDFFMPREEVLDFSVKFDGGGDDSEKGITWISSNPNVIKIGKHSKNPELSWYCSFTALREGTSTIVARSTYNPSLTAAVSITVLDNSDFTYFWQLDPDGPEKSYFVDADGYPSREGVAIFGSMNWNYQFEKAPIAVTGGQSLKFGSKDQPFGALHFEAENTKKIRKISVLCSSAAEHIDDGSAHGRSGDVGTSNITIKVGDTTYVDNVSTPKNSNDSSIELDTITGDIRDENPMTGKISIDFSPTYYDASTKENSGAIYLKAIIVEYYRGDLQSIDVSVINDYNTQFYVGTKFDSRGFDVNAHYSASPSTNVKVGYLTTFEMDNLDENGNFASINNNQKITARFAHNENQVVTADFYVDVAGPITSLEINGEMEKTTFLEKERMDYTGLVLDIKSNNGSETVVTQSFNLNEYDDDKFLAVFDVSNVQKYASPSLEDEFIISFRHYLSNNTARYTFASRELDVQVVTNLEVIYDSETPLSLVEGTKIEYTNFKTKVTYDNDEDTSESIPFAELKNHTYHDDKTGYDLYRFNYIPNSPLVATKEMATSGFEVVVKSATNEITGSLRFEPTDFSIKYIQSISLKLDTFKTTTYEEGDNLDFTGLKLDISYSDSTVDPNIAFADFMAMTTAVSKTKTEKGNIVTDIKNVPLFTLDAPKTASLELAQGFDIKVISTRDENVTSTLHVESNVLTIKEIEAKTYQKITSTSDIVNNAKYVFVSLENGQKSMKVWNGDLEPADVRSKTNYFVVSQTELIGEELTIKNGPLSRATFTLVSASDGKFAIKHKSGKYFPADNGSSTTPLLSEITNPKAQYEVSFDDFGNASLKSTYQSSGVTEIRYIKYNSAGNSDKFGGYKITNTSNHDIQLYKLITA